MRKRVISIMWSILVLGSLFFNASISARAEDDSHADIVVDGSRLTYNYYSHGNSGTYANPMLMGEHLMSGDSIIAKTGNGKIYTYGQTTADHDVDFVAVLVYVDRYDESDGLWGFVDGRAEDARNTYYVISTKTLKVDRGYYYRVHCEHFAGNDDEEMHDSAISYTDGIWIP